MATARSSVALASPTLPPSASSASAMTPAGDGAARVPKNGRDRGVRLANRDAHRGDLGEFCQQRVGDGPAGGLDQAVVAPCEDGRGGIDDRAVIDRIGELVGAR